MHNSFLIGLWAGVSFVLYKVVASILEARRHARNARKLGCEPAHNPTGWDRWSIFTVWRLTQAEKKALVPAHFKQRFDDASAKEGRLITTLYQNQFGNDFFLTTEPKNIQALLATQFKDFGLGDLRNGNFRPLLGHGIFSSDGKQWEHSRALLRPQFAREQVSDLELEEQHVQNLLTAMSLDADGWTQSVDMLSLFYRLTLDSATEFLFGESVNSQLSSLPGYVANRPPMAVSEKDFAFSFDAAQTTIAQASRLGDIKLAVQMMYDKNFKNHCKVCHDFIDHYVYLALSKDKKPEKLRPSGKPIYVFLDALVESTRDPIELRTHLISILLAGRDTTAALLSFVYMVFEQRPDIYRKLRTIVLADFGTYANPRNLSFSALKSCNYLQWILNETLRLYPVVALDGRRALKDTSLPLGGGPDGSKPVYIPAGTEVLYTVYAMHRRPDLWGEDAEEFKPERWDGNKPGWSYLPFNGGPRICIGQQFALTEAGYVLVRLVQRFAEIKGMGNSWDEEAKGGVGYVRFKTTLTGTPADGVHIRMREAKDEE